MAHRLTSRIIQDADVVIVLSVPESRKLPGMLGRIVPAILQYHGWYTCTLDGLKTLYTTATTKPEPEHHG